jgi:putative transposase
VGKNYQSEKIDASALAVPETVSVALGDIVEDMREGLLALAVGTGLQVMASMMEADVAALAGPKAVMTRTGRRCAMDTVAGR